MLENQIIQKINKITEPNIEKIQMTQERDKTPLPEKLTQVQAMNPDLANLFSNRQENSYSTRKILTPDGTAGTAKYVQYDDNNDEEAKVPEFNPGPVAPSALRYQQTEAEEEDEWWLDCRRQDHAFRILNYIIIMFFMIKNDRK